MYLFEKMLHSAKEEALHVRRMDQLIGKKYFAILQRFPKHFLALRSFLPQPNPEKLQLIAHMLYICDGLTFHLLLFFSHRKDKSSTVCKNTLKIIIHRS